MRAGDPESERAQKKITTKKITCFPRSTLKKKEQRSGIFTLPYNAPQAVFWIGGGYEDNENALWNGPLSHWARDSRGREHGERVPRIASGDLGDGTLA